MFSARIKRSDLPYLEPRHSLPVLPKPITDKELMERETALVVEIERLLPDVARSCRGSEDLVIVHQDAFVAAYQDEEYALFAQAMSIHGKEIRVIGKNKETLTTAKAAELLDRPETIESLAESKSELI